MSNQDEPKEEVAGPEPTESAATPPSSGVPWAALVGTTRATPPSPASQPSAASTPGAIEPDPEASSADAAPTQVMDPVDDAPARDESDPDATQVFDPVVLAATPGMTAPAAPADPEAQPDVERPAPTADREWMGVTAFIAGALALSPVAIVLGHLGLGAAKKGRARHRSFAIAGLVLGYLGLAAIAAGVYLLLTQSTSPEAIDIQAQQDVTAVGAAAATQAVDTGMVPDVEQSDAGYLVAGETIVPELETQHALTFTGSTATDWCLEITYAGGNQTAVSYTATGGMAQGACAAG